MRRALWASVALGCTPVVPEELDGVPIAAARIEGLGGAGLQMIVGGWGGSGELHATTVDGEQLVLPVEVSAGSAGAMMEMAVVTEGIVELELPREPITGDALFGTYKGVREGAVVLVGAVGVHLQNDAGVRIDETRLAFGIALHVSWSWLSMSLKEEEPGSGTGFTGDTAPSELTGFVPWETTGEVLAGTGDTG